MKDAWIPTIEQIEFSKDAPSLSDVRHLFTKLLDSVGAAALARLLGVNPAMVSRWRQGASISTEMSGRILDTYDVLTRALRVFPARYAARWLFAEDPILGARPLDVLVMRGAGPVIAALDSIADGSYT